MQITTRENLQGTLRAMRVGDTISTTRRNSVARSTAFAVAQDYDRTYKTAFDKETRQTIITRTR